MSSRTTRAFLLALAGGLAVALAPAGAGAQDFKPFKLNAVGNVMGVPQFTEVEKPIFEGLKEKSNGRIEVRFRGFHELGMKGDEMIRLASRGNFDIVALLAGYISGDAPFFIGIDIPGLAPTLEDARKQSDAYRDVLDKYLQEKFNLTLLAVWPNPLQILWCRDPVNSLDDLKGKRIRVHSTALAALVKGIGGVYVSIPFAEVYTAMQRGVADCAATSTVAGNAQKWYEVTNHFVTLPLGWATTTHVAYKGFWDGLEPGAREFLKKEISRMEQALWDLARDRGEDGLNCSLGKECKYGTKGAMKSVYRLTSADLARVRDIVSGSVLSDWAADCAKTYQPCAKQWNDTIGKVVGISIKQ
ncbi:MAG: TRAP transporter substrate-binding protein [Proteobacteria bacterium]|nr:TRAP transporter substrate-binding protein [Pseudomonadota bacterium]